MITKAYKNETLSRLGMGNMRLPLIPGGTDKDIDFPAAEAIIDYAMAHGINYYDTAFVYHGGNCEKTFAKAIAKYPRDSYNIAAKYTLNASADYEGMFRRQLENFNTDHIDFYLLHCITDGNAEKYKASGCIAFFERMKAEGRIRNLGFSSHASTAVLRDFADLRDWDFVQIQLNYYDWLFGTAKEEYEILTERNIPVVVMESVRGGRLANLESEANAMLQAARPEWSISSWAFRFLMGLDNVQLCLSGMSSLAQIEDNVQTFEALCPLTAEEEALLFEACRVFKKNLTVPCTACRYCTDGCPMGINIPEMLSLYNRYKLEGNWALYDLKNIETKGQPQDCVGCGACTGHCPQSIDTPAILKELSAALEKIKR